MLNRKNYLRERTLGLRGWHSSWKSLYHLESSPSRASSETLNLIFFLSYQQDRLPVPLMLCASTTVVAFSISLKPKWNSETTARDNICKEYKKLMSSQKNKETFSLSWIGFFIDVQPFSDHDTFLFKSTQGECQSHY